MKLEAGGCGGDSDNEAGAKWRRLRLLRSPSAGEKRRDFVGQAVPAIFAVSFARCGHLAQNSPPTLAFSLIS